jgi:hypothetical protein
MPDTRSILVHRTPNALSVTDARFPQRMGMVCTAVAASVSSHALARRGQSNAHISKSCLLRLQTLAPHAIGHQAARRPGTRLRRCRRTHLKQQLCPCAACEALRSAQRTRLRT